MAWKERLWKTPDEGTAADLNNIELGIREARLTSILSPLPNGTDDTAAIQAWLTSAQGQKAVWQPAGGQPYKIKSPLEPPVESWIEAVNPEATEIERIGNGDLFRLSGDTVVQNLYARAATKQAEGSAFDCSHHNSDKITFRNIQLGNNFFNGYNLVGPTGVGLIFMDTIVFQEPGSRVKGYGGAGFVIGSSTQRTIGVWMDKVYVGVNEPSDMPNAFKIVNTDSLHMAKILVQNAGTAFNFGEGDASALLTTNGMFNDLQADGCTRGFLISNLVERHTFTACTAEACTNGAVQQGIVSGLKFLGCSFSVNQQHGYHVLASTPAAAVGFNGCDFNCNGQEGAAGQSGMICDAKTGGFLFNGCNFGNPTFAGPAKQKIGLSIGAEVKNVGLFGNRFDANGVGVNYEVGAGTSEVPASEAALKTNNLVA